MTLSFPSGTNPLAQPILAVGAAKDLKSAALAVLITAVTYLEPLTNSLASKAVLVTGGVM